MPELKTLVAELQPALTSTNGSTMFYEPEEYKYVEPIHSPRRHVDEFDLQMFDLEFIYYLDYQKQI